LKTVVEAKGLVKRYTDKNAVDGLNLEVMQGEIFGLLGPNGAGKSSAMKMMYGSSSVTAGELYVLGLNAQKNFRKIKERVGVVPQDESLDNDLTVIENLIQFARYQLIDKVVARKRAEELLRLVRMEDHRDDAIQVLSGGMRRRLAIARGMINNPEVLFLDEPTSGLDPDVRFWIWDFLEKIRSEMGTVILTTHYMEEAERLCDRVAMIDHGKVLLQGKPAELIRSQIGVEVVELQVERQDIGYYSDRLRTNQFRYLTVGRNINVHLQEGQKSQDVLALVHSTQVVIRKSNLNDVFLRTAGHDLRGEML
jgi:lipooligosaccharide transport system ATP-binding protein